MKRLLLIFVFFLLLPFKVLAAEGDIVTITGDTILLQEPQFTSFIKGKMPQLYGKLDRLSNTRDLLHLDVDVNSFDQLFLQVEDYYSLSKDLNSNIEEYTKEAETIRERILQEQVLTSPEAIRRILDFKFLEKNIRYAKDSLQAIHKDLNILLTLLKKKTIKVTDAEIKKGGMRGFTGFLVFQLEDLKNKKISLREYRKLIRKDLKRVAKSPEAADLANRFAQLAAEISGEGKLGEATKSSFSGVSTFFSNILNYELYILENKKVTPLNIIRVIVGVLILVALYRGIRFYMKARSVDPGRRYVIRVLVRYAMYMAMVPVILYGLGLDMTKITLLVSALSVGIGFGLQKIFSNLISGIILLLDKSIKRGDTIEIEDVYGVVTAMRARSVFVRTRDGKEYLVPNESLLVNNVINWTHSDSKLRLKIPVGVSYDCDVDQAIKLCLQVADGIERLLKNPAPKCLLKGFGDNSIDLELRVWIRDPEHGIRNVSSDILVAIWRIFKENDIEIPFPQRDLHMRTISPELLDHFPTENK